MKNKIRKGFTLIELLMVVMVIAILAGTIMVSGDESLISAEANNIISHLRIIKTAALEWLADHGDYINHNTYAVTYPKSSTVGTIQGLMANSTYRQTMMKYIRVTPPITLSDSSAGTPNEDEYAITDGNSNNKSRWFAVYKIKSGGNGDKIKKRLESIAEEFELLNDSFAPYTQDSECVYKEIVDFEKYYGKK